MDFVPTVKSVHVVCASKKSNQNIRTSKARKRLRFFFLIIFTTHSRLFVSRTADAIRLILPQTRRSFLSRPFAVTTLRHIHEPGDHSDLTNGRKGAGTNIVHSNVKCLPNICIICTCVCVCLFGKITLDTQLPFKNTKTKQFLLNTTF